MGIIFDIQKFCLHDGPGIRTTVFLKGCNIRCLWCHNPESFQKQPELSYTASNCIGCERCTTVCPVHAHSFDENGHHIDRSLCTACGTCVQECLTNALKIFGMERSVQDILSEVVKDRPYFEQSGGGITISGGEPTTQYDFLLELLTEAKKENLHMLENLAYMNEIHHPLILRCPIIPGCNDTEEHFSAIRHLQESYSCIQSCEIMPYHSLGSSKWEQLGRDYSLSDLPDASMEQKAFWNYAASNPSMC